MEQSKCPLTGEWISKMWYIHTVEYHCCLVNKLCLTLCNPMDFSPSCSSVHRIFPSRILEWVCHFLLQGFFPTQGLSPCLPHLLHWQANSLPMSQEESLQWNIIPSEIRRKCFSYWSIFALQCCVRFCSAARWISHIFSFIPSLDFLPQSSVTTKHWIDFPMLYSCFSLVIY